MRNFIKTLWQVMRRPSTHYSLGFLTLGGFIGGIVFWGGFNTALEATNTEAFCISCHEMEANLYADLQQTVHFTNASGVRAKCSDCHVPHEWTNKIARKIAASKEVYGKIFGTISTREKFEEHRLEMARREWARFEANDSLECRNCHSFTAMDFSRQSPRAAEQHERMVGSGEATCIDCHKGIAHTLPNMSQEQARVLLSPPQLPGDGSEQVEAYLEQTQIQ
ncbi:NapC/NirT family cytochrome c [Maritimibacter sp. UBA3975]|uniref:NapC/NirT family cytochrome c n=1 Tax=Maritimibacter sp. UBA3975 TaxID=1946833 RepID=UPI000C0948AC|nr:NapC/NirT family cytochrome c [Maritimibacter sp. UBA3975]MAM63369.1 cytochrome C [Maritimibacter sp.]|tara:strand:- start:109416 stop:110081 length:666 start_codon:yes stop_codon:yes gene_type:complete